MRVIYYIQKTFKCRPINNKFTAAHVYILHQTLTQASFLLHNNVLSEYPTVMNVFET